MAIKLGNTLINNAKLGNTQLSKIMLGTIQIFPSTSPTTTTTTTTSAPVINNLIALELTHPEGNTSSWFKLTAQYPVTSEITVTVSCNTGYVFSILKILVNNSESNIVGIANSSTGGLVTSAQITVITPASDSTYNYTFSNITTTTTTSTTTTTTTVLTLYPITVGYNSNDYQLACMAATSSYYIDNSNFYLAGYIYSDFTGETYATDGFYSNGTVYRQSVNGVLHAPEACS